MVVSVTDSAFQRAIELIDTGEVNRLRDWLNQHPRLLTETVRLGENSAGDYFANPKLLWFVAENPVRNGSLPSNIVTVAETIIQLAKAEGVADLKVDLDYTLTLVASGRVARGTGQQVPLIELLTRSGADADSAVIAALGHREREAAERLSRCGARMTLALASGLGRLDDVERLAPLANRDELQEALTLAAVNGEAAAVETLIRRGADPALFNSHVHAHTTPLHQAIDAGSLATVKVLVAGGASIATRDKAVNADAWGWARHFGHDDIVAWLEQI